MSHAISEAHKNIILKAHLPQAKIIAFGSRIRGGAKAYSDLDLCLDDGQPIPLAKISQLEESFAATDIPYKIDIVDFHGVDDHFQKHILSYGVQW